MKDNTAKVISPHPSQELPLGCVKLRHPKEQAAIGQLAINIGTAPNDLDPSCRYFDMGGQRVLGRSIGKRIADGITIERLLNLHLLDHIERNIAIFPEFVTILSVYNAESELICVSFRRNRKGHVESGIMDHEPIQELLPDGSTGRPVGKAFFHVPVGPGQSQSVKTGRLPGAEGIFHGPGKMSVRVKKMGDELQIRIFIVP